MKYSDKSTSANRFDIVCDLVELPFHIKFSFSRKLKGSNFPAISKWQIISGKNKKITEK
jgi:hypothetical protein